MNLADNLKKIRKDNNLSQEQLADKLNVSRQAVSKWESGQAYPEMDKVLQLCQIFDLNIDELLNQDIKEVNNKKEAKLSVNKFVDDFLDYITKTVNMFSSMKLRDKFKCIFEELLIAFILTLIFLIIGSIFGSVINNIIRFMPDNISNILFSIISGIYIVICLVIGIIILLNIFKVRYLDYYVVVNEIETDDDTNYSNKNNEELKEVKSANNNSKEKIFLEKKQEKIIIRDENHSGYKFMSSLLKVLLWFIKLFASLTAIFFSMILISFVVALVISFLFIKTKLLFVGILLIILACIAINLVILIKLYNFINSVKIKRGRLALIFIISIFTIGLGIGLISIGISKFTYIDDMTTDYFMTEEAIIDMTDDLIIFDYFDDVEYVESDNKNIKIESTHSKYCKLHVSKDKKYVTIYNLYDSDSEYNIIYTIIEDINNRRLVNYSKGKIKIYTTRENIQKLQKNLSNYNDEQYNINRQISEYQDTINSLEDEIIEKDEKIRELEQEIENLKYTYE